MDQQPPEVHDHESAVEFIKWCIGRLGLGYHPDTDFDDYIDGNGNSVFTPAEARHLDEQTERAFGFCDPYDVGQHEFKKLMAKQQTI